MVDTPDAVQTFEAELKKLESLDLKKIFETHQPQPITDKHFMDFNLKQLTTYLREHCLWLSWSHMPNQASKDFQKLMGQYNLLIGHLADRSGTQPLYPPLHELGTNMDTLGSNLHEKNLKESTQSLNKVKQSFAKVKSTLKQSDIKADSSKDPLMKAFKKMSAPMIMLAALPAWSLTGKSRLKIPEISTQFNTNSISMMSMLDGRMSYFDKNNMVPQSKMFQFMHDDIESLKTRPPKKLQDAVLQHTAAIKQSTIQVNKCKDCKDFLPGESGATALGDIHTRLNALDGVMTPQALDAYAEPIETIGDTLITLKNNPDAASTLLSQTSALQDKTTKNLSMPNLFKRPIMGDSIAMMPPFLLLQHAIPGVLDNIRKHKTIVDKVVSTGSVTSAGGKAKATLHPDSIKSLASMSDHMQITSDHLKQSQKKMQSYDQQTKAQYSLTEKSNELKKTNPYMRHKETLDQTSQTLAVKKQQMHKCPAYVDAADPVEKKLMQMHAKLAKVQTSELYKKHTIALDGHVNTLTKHMFENPEQADSLLPALNHLQVAKSFIAIAAGTVVAPTVLTMGGDHKAALEAQKTMQTAKVADIKKLDELTLVTATTTTDSAGVVTKAKLPSLNELAIPGLTPGTKAPEMLPIPGMPRILQADSQASATATPQPAVPGARPPGTTTSHPGEPSLDSAGVVAPHLGNSGVHPVRAVPPGTTAPHLGKAQVQPPGAVPAKPGELDRHLSGAAPPHPGQVEAHPPAAIPTQSGAPGAHPPGAVPQQPAVPGAYPPGTTPLQSAVPGAHSPGTTSPQSAVPGAYPPRATPTQPEAPGTHPAGAVSPQQPELGTSVPGTQPPAAASPQQQEPVAHPPGVQPPAALPAQSPHAKQSQAGVGGAAAGGMAGGAAGGGGGGAGAGGGGGGGGDGGAGGAGAGVGGAGAGAGAGGGGGGSGSDVAQQQQAPPQSGGPLVVCLGGILQCGGGIAPTPILVFPEGGFADIVQPIANFTTFIPNSNIIPFGACISPAHPGVIPDGPQNCAATVAPWGGGGPLAILTGMPPVNMQSKCTCMITGESVKPIFSGQFNAHG